ncbi:hypothetical protein DFH28DRAFT_26259 [Melampsora americana]|nr:hypothetical protein DFH28DRAFT_26259 [Melampsora americana]
MSQRIRNLMQSDKGTWADQMIELLNTPEEDQFERDDYENHFLFESLIKLIEIDEVPIDAMLVVWAKVLDMGNYEPQHSEKYEGNFSMDDIYKVKSSYGKKIIEHINTLETRGDLYKFAMIHRGLGKYSIELSGDWSPESQKELFALWTDDKTWSNNGITSDKQLQKVLENQIVQTCLLRALHSQPEIDHKVSHVYREWTVQTLIEQSKTVVNYITSLNHLTAKPFISAQKYLQPYGLSIDPLMSYKHRLDIVKFWADHIVVLVMMKDLGETEVLQDAINMLVADNVQEANRLMNEFLKNKDPLGFRGKTPVLAEFLEFCVEHTDIFEQKKISRDALNNFLFGMKEDVKRKLEQPSFWDTIGSQ